MGRGPTWPFGTLSGYADIMVLQRRQRKEGAFPDRASSVFAEGF